MAGTYLRLLYHIVFSTKHRIPLIQPDLEAELYPYLEGIARRKRGWLLALGGMPDHVHLLVRLTADVSMAEMVRLLKTNSSKWLHEERHREDFAWQSGYAAFTVSDSKEGAVRGYIGRQKKHHQKMAFQEELVALLKRHRIEFDPAYLWD